MWTMKRFAAIIILGTLFLTVTYPCSAQSSLSRTCLPPLPDTMAFAGERVPLENFDTRESLQRELLVMTYMHSRTLLTLLRTTRYFPVIKPIMAEFGIPEDFVFLCMAESGLDPNALSIAGAGGIWQIMPAVGKSYGLSVGNDIDERYHIEKATETACRILNENYAEFGSWTLAAAAYNLGKNGVRRRIDKQGVSDYYDAFFPEETMRYVFRILTFKLLVESPRDYGFEVERDDYYLPFADYREESVSGHRIDWSQTAIQYGTTYKMLRVLNPWIRDYEYHNSTVDRSFTVKIPSKNFRIEP